MSTVNSQLPLLLTLMGDAPASLTPVAHGGNPQDRAGSQLTTDN
ncbi:hypothetical protein [Dendronalium sp. ChiSLP03b]|nr:hypothetical protein [Dendronalium sp. ChiSLP03b]MDZ8208982.1 hypothetical protein [Dendronalium sp. ChiSLP03b]